MTSIGFLPINPDSLSCQNLISVSPCFQHKQTSSSNLFEGKSKSFEYRSTWKKGTTPSSHEQFGVVVRNNNCVVGAMNWYWWGSAGHIQGIELYVCLKNRENLINFIIDIRPTESLPTFGPNLTESSFLSQDSTNRLADIVDLISEYKYQSKVYGH